MWLQMLTVSLVHQNMLQKNHVEKKIAQAKRRATDLEVEALAIKNKETQNPGERYYSSERVLGLN